MLRCCGFVPLRMMMRAEPQSVTRDLLHWQLQHRELTCLSIRLDGVQGPERVAAAGDVGVPPELRAGQLQHLPEYCVPAQLAGESQTCQSPLVLDVGIGVLPRVSESVAVHPELTGHHHHVEDGVTVGVLGVRVGSLVQEEVVNSLITVTISEWRRQVRFSYQRKAAQVRGYSPM